MKVAVNVGPGMNLGQAVAVCKLKGMQSIKTVKEEIFGDYPDPIHGEIDQEGLEKLRGMPGIEAVEIIEETESPEG